jgi:hypothetical protein
MNRRARQAYDHWWTLLPLLVTAVAILAAATLVMGA